MTARRAHGWSWVAVPLAIYLTTRLIAGAFLVIGASRQVALTGGGSGYKVTAPSPASPGYLGVVSNWDGQWYRLIAEHGYPLDLPRVGGQVVSNEWAFTPGYPFLVRAVMFVSRVDFPLAATMVSLACGALAVTLLYGMVRRWLDGFAATSLTLGICCFPAAPVLQVAYTESLALLLVVLAIGALSSRRYGWWLSWSILLAVTRPVLLPLALVGALAWLGRWRRREVEDFPARERWVFAACCATCLAMVGLWPAVATVVTGEPGAFTETMAAWPVNREFGGATVNWLTLSVRDPLGWGIVVVPVVALVAWTALRSSARALPGAARWWAPVYMLYILAATKPSAGLLRYLLVAVFPTMPVLEKRDAPGTGADRVARIVFLAVVSTAGLVGQYYWVTEVFTISNSPEHQLFP
jgi:hypothetical protein